MNPLYFNTLQAEDLYFFPLRIVLASYLLRFLKKPVGHITESTLGTEQLVHYIYGFAFGAGCERYRLEL